MLGAEYSQTSYIAINSCIGVLIVMTGKSLTEYHYMIGPGASETH